MVLKLYQTITNDTIHNSCLLSVNLALYQANAKHDKHVPKHLRLAKASCDVIFGFFIGGALYLLPTLYQLGFRY
jgi:hypothetical protein